MARRLCKLESALVENDISVLVLSLEKRLLAIPGVSKSQPHLTEWRMEMTRYSLEKLKRDLDEIRI